MDLLHEILLLLSEHGSTGLDYVSLFMFLNTVAGGHYQERWSEPELKTALAAALGRGWIEVRSAEDEAPLPPELAARPGGPCLHLTATGQSALFS